ncbi:IS6 family transposase [Streptomyces hirsutus]
MDSAPPSYQGHRYPVEIIAHGVAVLPVPAQLPRGRGADARARRHRVLRDDPPLVRQVRAGLRRRTKPPACGPGDTWHLDEVFIKINGVRHYLWRAVDQHGNVLDILLQSRRNAKAAKRFMAKLMKKQRRVPRVLVTDKLRSYNVARRELMRSVENRSHKGLNHRAENSHQPTRQRERAMKGFRSAGAAQGFLSAFSGISPHFRPRHHLMTATEHRAEMTVRFVIWDQITGAAAMPTAA